MLIIGSLSCFLLGVLVIINNPRKLVNILAAGTNFFLSIWTLGVIIFMQTTSADVAYLSMKMCYASAAVSIVLLALFSAVFPTGKGLSRKVATVVLASCVVLVSLILLLPGFVIIKETADASGNFCHVVDPTSYFIYAAYFVVFFLAVIIVILRKYIIETSKEIKSQLGLYLVGILAISIPGLVTALVMPYLHDCSLSWIGPAMTSVFVLLVSYGIIRHGMFDIRSAAVRTLAYILSLGVLVVVYYALATIISGVFLDSNMAIDQSPLSIGLALGLLFIFQPVKRFFDRLTNSIFYRDNYNSDEFFARFNRLLTSTIDLRYLLERTADEISTTLKSEQAFFYIHTRDGHYITAGTPHHRQLRKADVDQLLAAYSEKSGVIVASLLAEDDPILHLMTTHRIELILPLVQTNIIGYLCIGDHRTSRYTSRDVKVLSTVADGLVIAIQNTLSIQEIRDINASNLQHRIADATKDLRTSNALLKQIDEEKDEFVSVASHELRTPMTVIRGYISLLERGQLGVMTDNQKSILEKMNNNTQSLIQLVNDMLDLSKLESNKLEINLTNNSLSGMVENSINQMSLLFKNKGIALVFDGDDTIVNTDADKFDRILMNLLSNAYKFTHGGGKVNVTTTVDKASHKATVCVADTGVGIPAVGMENLFKKFSQVESYLQRQSGGTGLGLSICKGLIEKLGGKIWVDSTVSVGSKFYFTVPISRIK